MVRWWLLVVVVGLMALATSASAEWVGYRYGDRGEGVIERVDGDPYFKPTLEQVTGWVNDGINAAAEDTSLWDIPGVSSNLRIANNPCWDGRLRFVVALSPQLVCTVAGWDAAQDDDTWEQIQNGGKDAVAGKLAKQLYGSGNAFGREVPFLIGLEKGDVTSPLTMNGMIWAYGKWRDVALSPGGTANRIVDDRPSNGNPSVRWAGPYALSWLMYEPLDWDSMAIVRGYLYSRQQRGPNIGLTDLVQAPETGWRLVLGKPEEHAWVDFN